MKISGYHDFLDPLETPVEVNDAVFDDSKNQYEEMQKGDRTLGWTDYIDLNVTGSCSCEKDESGKKYLRVDYTVKWRAHIYLRSFLREGIEYDRPLSKEGVLGHEQQHVHGAIKLVRVKVIEKYLTKITAKTENLCQAEVKKQASDALKILNSILAKNYERHSNKNPGDSAFSDEPASGRRYQYIDLRWGGGAY